jgi:hypothetical protein
MEHERNHVKSSDRFFFIFQLNMLINNVSSVNEVLV